jgi:hypothetical protein
MPPRPPASGKPCAACGRSFANGGAIRTCASTPGPSSSSSTSRRVAATSGRPATPPTDAGGCARGASLRAYAAWRQTPVGRQRRRLMREGVPVAQASVLALPWRQRPFGRRRCRLTRGGCARGASLRACASVLSASPRTRRRSAFQPSRHPAFASAGRPARRPSTRQSCRNPGSRRRAARPTARDR